MRRYLFVVVFGLGGLAVLVNLSLWQLRRLEASDARIAAIAVQMDGPTQILPAEPDPVKDRYIPVISSGVMGHEEVRVLTATKRGAAYRIVVPFETVGRRVLLDRGIVPEAELDALRYRGAVTVRGHLDWPQEVDGFTPDPNPEKNQWFARDVAAMAAWLKTEPVMIVAAEPTGSPSPAPVPVTPRAKVDHLNYAITWGLMAVVWLAMTAYLVLRIRRNTA